MSTPAETWMLALIIGAVILFAACFGIEMLTKAAGRLQHAAVYLMTMFFEWRSRRRQRRRGR